MKPTVPEVLAKVREYEALPGNGAGGNLHIVIDDGNIRDSDVMFCREAAEDDGDTAGVELAKLLLKMSKTQRRKIHLLH